MQLQRKATMAASGAVTVTAATPHQQRTLAAAAQRFHRRRCLRLSSASAAAAAAAITPHWHSTTSTVAAAAPWPAPSSALCGGEQALQCRSAAGAAAAARQGRRSTTTTTVVCAAAAASASAAAPQQQQQQQQPLQQQQQHPPPQQQPQHPPAKAPPMTVAITGATGLVGSRLAAKLAARGHAVRVLTRDVRAARAKLPYPRLTFHGPNEWEAAIANAGGVVNLAGAPVSTRWTEAIKREIRDSRVGTTRRVVAAIAALPEAARPRVLVSASAVGFYGSSGGGGGSSSSSSSSGMTAGAAAASPAAATTASCTEDSPPGRDFLARVCVEWEAAARAAPPGVRVVVVRSGIVLARDGGALGRMLPSFELFAGGPLGTGKQPVSWIERDDLVALLTAALTDARYDGTYNGTAPAPVTMAQFCAAVGSALGKPSWLPVPDFALSGLLGEGAAVVLEGQRVLPARAAAAGFRWRYPSIDEAARAILSK